MQESKHCSADGTVLLCSGDSAYTISGMSPQFAQFHDAKLKELRTGICGSLPDERFKMMALDEVYSRNEAARWLRLKKI